MKISELKKDAISKLSGKWGKAIGIYFVYVLISFSLALVVTFIDAENVLLPVINILISLITSSFSYGILVSMLKLSRTENVDLMDFVIIGLKNIVKVIKISILTILRLWLPILLYIISIGTLASTIVAVAHNLISTSTTSWLLIASAAITIVSFILYYVQSLYYVLSYYLLFDNPSATTKELLNKSKEIMTGKRFKHFTLGLSFFGWILLTSVVTILLAIVFPIASPLILLIATTVLLPYVEFSYINFYESAAGISNVAEEK